MPHHILGISSGRFADFIRMKIISGNDVGIPPIYRHKTYAQTGIIETDADVFTLRAKKLRYFKNITNKMKENNYDNFIIVNYDEISKDPSKIIKIFENVGVPLKGKFRNVDTYKGLPGVSYVPKEYPLVSDEELKYINSKFDWSLENFFSYTKEAYNLNTDKKIIYK
jgi:hypothetical protein